MQASPILLGIGVVAEFVGIVFLGFPDLRPEGLRFSRWLRRHGRRVTNLLRRVVRRPPRGVVHEVSGSVTAGGGMSASGIVGPGRDATSLEDKVEYLLRRDEAAQRAANALAARLNRLEATSSRQLAEARREMEDHVARELTAAREEYRPLRIAGTILLAVGLACITLATFLA